jgi:hypothetical protein
MNESGWSGREMKESNASGSSETDPSSIAELDLALINALQIHSRASWALIGQVLDISAVTAARRWDRLASGGIGSHLKELLG